MEHILIAKCDELFFYIPKKKDKYVSFIFSLFIEDIDIYTILDYKTN